MGNPSCQIAIDSPDISHRHARLAIEGSSIRIEDLGSTNGTLVKGQLINGLVEVQAPSRIQVGSALIDISLVEPTPGVPAHFATESPPQEQGPEADLHQARNYQVGPEIARGGMGVVLEARDRNLGRKVAMKVVVSGQAASRESRLRFIREARVLGQLEHPNIVPIHELGIDPAGRVFYTMKRIQGLTLHQVLEEIQSGNPHIIAQYPLSHF